MPNLFFAEKRKKLQDLTLMKSYINSACLSYYSSISALSRAATAPLIPKEEKAEKFRQQLKAFLNDPVKTEYEFSASLNSHDRMVVHEVKFLVI